MLHNVRFVLALAILVFNAPAIRCRKTEVHHNAKTVVNWLTQVLTVAIQTCIGIQDSVGDVDSMDTSALHVL